MNKVKVNDLVSAYSKALGLDNNVKNILIELMENIITKYEKIVDYIPVSLDDSQVYLIKPINGKYSVEDFFLNRLMRNVWSYSEINENTIKEGFVDEHTKGCYDASFNEVNINKIKLSNQLEKYKQYLGVNYLSMKSSAEKKVIMHEFEHGLQTRFDNQLNVTNRSVYKSISDELLKLGKYNDILNSYEILPKSLSDRNNYLSTGVYYSSYSDSLGIKTYKNVDGYDNLNEILNETESLEMSNQNLYLNAILEDGNYYPFINPESSNSAITNYGYLIKILLGEQKTFEAMYLNPQILFETFNNKYTDIFQTLYNSNNDAITILIEQLNVIKNLHKTEDILKLNEVFAKCLEYDINNDLKANILEDILKSKIENFSKYVVRNNDLEKNKDLNHIKVLDDIKNNIINSKANENINDRNKTLINSLNKDLLNSKIKLNEYSNISFKQYLEEAFYSFIPDNDFVELSNGATISIKQYLEEIVFTNAEKYGRNIENLINNTIKRNSTIIVDGEDNMMNKENNNYQHYLDNIMRIIKNRRKQKENSIELTTEEKENIIFDIHENIKLMSKVIKSIDEISKVFDYVIENIGKDTFENKISNDILSSLPIKQFKEVKSNEISDNLNSKILYFVNKCKTLENSYIEFKNNNLKDTETLKELISNNYLLKEEGILLLRQNISDEGRKIINYNIMLLQEQEENMKKFNFNLEETIDDFNRKL